MKIAPLGPVIRRICTSCNLEFGAEAELDCPKCRTRLVEVRGVADEMMGTVICDRFEIRDKLGQGGMGTVYRAWQRSVQREVAIKLIESSYSKDPMAVQRFEREAQLASRLSQPNTVSVIDFGQTGDGRLFIAMELIRGRTLGKVLNTEGIFSVNRAVRVGVQICDALEAAHELGIVHRDLKLENLSVLDHPAGRDLVKVLDFGLAKQFGDQAKGTAAGVVVGTPRYMAPETAMQGIVGPAGDVYALGVILAEVTIGHALWEGTHLRDLLDSKLHPAPVLQEVPPRLRPVVAAMIDPDPARRPTAAEARKQLIEVVDEAIRSAPPIVRTDVTAMRRAAVPRRRRWPVVAVAAAAGAIGAVVTVLVVMRNGDEPPARPAAAAAAPAGSDDKLNVLATPDLITKPEPIVVPGGSGAPPLAPIAEIAVLLRITNDVRFEIWEGDHELARGSGTIVIRNGRPRDLVVHARGYQDEKVRVDGTTPSVVVTLHPSADRDDLVRPTPPPDCSKQLLNDSRHCVAEYCAVHHNDSRCLE